MSSERPVQFNRLGQISSLRLFVNWRSTFAQSLCSNVWRVIRSRLKFCDPARISAMEDPNGELEVLYETRHHASRPYTSHYPPQQVISLTWIWSNFVWKEFVRSCWWSSSLTDGFQAIGVSTGSFLSKFSVTGAFPSILRHWYISNLWISWFKCW